MIPTGPISIGVQSVTQNGDTWTIQFTDGSGMQVTGGWSEFVSVVESRICEINAEFVKHFGLMRWIARNPTGANPNQIVGKLVTLDLTVANNANIFTVTNLP